MIMKQFNHPQHCKCLQREQRRTDLANLVENYDNLSINSYMGYLVDYFNLD